MQNTTGVVGQDKVTEAAGAEDILVKGRGYVLEMRGDELIGVVQVILKYTFLPLVFFGL